MMPIENSGFFVSILFFVFFWKAGIWQPKPGTFRCSLFSGHSLSLVPMLLPLGFFFFLRTLTHGLIVPKFDDLRIVLGSCMTGGRKWPRQLNFWRSFSPTKWPFTCHRSVFQNFRIFYAFTVLYNWWSVMAIAGWSAYICLEATVGSRCWYPKNERKFE